MDFAVSLMNIIAATVIMVFPFAFIIQFSLSYKSVDVATVTEMFTLLSIWTFNGLRFFKKVGTL
jgi:hypothetical protein